MADDGKKFTVSKIDAASSQLDTAIALWFHDQDPVSVHTLAAAAYQITHDIKRHRGIDHDLLYDSRMVKDEYRKEWMTAMKKAQNFFKHADRDPDAEGTVDLHDIGNVIFIMMGMAGLQLLGVKPSHQVNTFMLWLTLNEPSVISPDYLERFNAGAKGVGVGDLEDIRKIHKAEFFELVMSANAANEASRGTTTIQMPEF